MNEIINWFKTKLIKEKKYHTSVYGLKHILEYEIGIYLNEPTFYRYLKMNGFQIDSKNKKNKMTNAYHYLKIVYIDEKVKNFYNAFLKRNLKYIKDISDIISKL